MINDIDITYRSACLENINSSFCLFREGMASSLPSITIGLLGKVETLGHTSVF